MIYEAYLNAKYSMKGLKENSIIYVQITSDRVHFYKYYLQIQWAEPFPSFNVFNFALVFNTIFSLFSFSFSCW